MRGADSGPWSRLCALPALWAGLLYDDAALTAAWDLAKGWSRETREKARIDAARDGLIAEIDGRSVQAIARDVLAIARDGLKARAMPGSQYADETHFLDPLFEIAESGLTMGEADAIRLVEEFGGDVGKLMEANSF